MEREGGWDAGVNGVMCVARSGPGRAPIQAARGARPFVARPQPLATAGKGALTMIPSELFLDPAEAALP